MCPSASITRPSRRMASLPGISRHLTPAAGAALRSSARPPARAGGYGTACDLDPLNPAALQPASQAGGVAGPLVREQREREVGEPQGLVRDGGGVDGDPMSAVVDLGPGMTERMRFPLHPHDQEPERDARRPPPR